MRGLMFSVGGLNSSHNGLAVVGVNRWRVRGRVQMAVLVGLVSLAGLGFAMSSSLSAEGAVPAVPTIEGFQVNWEEADPEQNTYKFTFSGTIKNCDNLLDPTIKLFGYPFDAAVLAEPSGAFSREITMNGDEAFGRTIIATITDDGEQVSDDAFTST